MVRGVSMAGFGWGAATAARMVSVLVLVLALSGPPSWAQSGGDHGGTRGTAAEVSPGSDTAASLTEGDEDYFRISVPSEGRLTVRSAGDLDTYGYLQDSDGRRLAFNDDGGAYRNFRIERDVSAGIHYVRVRGYHRFVTGSYRLHVSFEASTPPPPPPAERGGTRETAMEVSLPSDTAASLTEGDEDYYRITVTSAGDLEV